MTVERHARERETLRGRAAAAEAARDRCRDELAALRRATALPREIVALLERQDTRVEPLAPQPGRGERATLLLNAAAGRAFVISTSDPPRAGSDLQLWVIRGKAAPAPAGFLRVAEGGVLLGEIDPALLAAGTPDAIAVSLEPAGGRPTPTEVVLVGVIGG
jgi:anti-sigma-K factor RskA